MNPYYLNREEISSYIDQTLRKIYWDAHKCVKMEILEILSKNNTSENHAFLISVIENETNTDCIERAIFSLKKNTSSLDFLVAYYQKSNDEYIKESVIETLESISISCALEKEKQEVLNQLFGTAYHYAISADCVKISQDSFEAEFQKRIQGNMQEIWMEFDDRFCFHFNSFETIDHQLNFHLLVVSKTNNYIPNDYFIPKGWMFMVNYSVEIDKANKLQQSTIRDTTRIISEILSYRNLNFEDFLEHETAFKKLLLQIHYDFRELSIEYSNDLSEAHYYDALVDEFIELVWLFKDSTDFSLYVQYGIELLKCSSEKYNYTTRLKYFEYLLTTAS